MKLNILTAAIVLIPLGLATPLSAQTKEPLPLSNQNALSTSTSSVQPTHQYPPQVVQAFMSACTRPRNNQSIDMMEQVCTCSINKIQNHYSFEQFTAIALEMKDSKEPPQEMKDFALRCAVETLSSQK
jgi:hypothetical protein